MGFFDLFKPKPSSCVFCGKLDNLVRIVSDDAYNGHVWYFYHVNCWKQVLAEPHKFSNDTVDLAIEISDSLREQDARLKRAAEYAEQRPNNTQQPK